VYNPQTVHPHEVQPREPSADAAPARQITLGPAVSLNVMNMIGVGPFITLPLVAAALGPGAWMGWLLGAALAVCDGLVWAELGAALPRAGGSYAFLREIYKPGETELQSEAHAVSRFDAGRFLSFLYVWQLMFTAPLSMASGALGLAQYAAFLFPGLQASWHIGPFVLHATSLLAASVCLLVVALLHRGLGAIVRTAELLSVGVLLTVAGVIAVGMTHLHAPLLRAQLHPLSGLHGGGLLPALGVATLITTYDYWGYYNVCFLGGEVREPGRTIPRAVLLSIAVVACLYLLMNFAVLGALPIDHLLRSTGAAQPMAAVLMRAVFAGRLGAIASVGVCVDRRAAARLLACAVCRGARGQFLRAVCAAASTAGVSAGVAGGARADCDRVLLFRSAHGDRVAGGGADPAAVRPAADGGDGAAGAAAAAGAAVSDVGVSASAAAGAGGVRISAVLSQRCGA
jgi:amino acid transporter